MVIVEKDGQRKAKRFKLNVPLQIATGHYERASDLQLREMGKDLDAERLRRAMDGPALLAKWDPYAAIITNPSTEDDS